MRPEKKQEITTNNRATSIGASSSGALYSLPRRIFFQIFKLLDFKSLLKLKLVSKFFKNYLVEPFLKDWLSFLPPEILLGILNFLDFRSLLNIDRISNVFRSL